MLTYSHCSRCPGHRRSRRFRESWRRWSRHSLLSTPTASPVVVGLLSVGPRRACVVQPVAVVVLAVTDLGVAVGGVRVVAIGARQSTVTIPSTSPKSALALPLRSLS